MRRALTAVFAHPDDETLATGATLAMYAAEGVRCSLYCATDGDAGRSSGIHVSSPAELGKLRHDELRAACAVVGIQIIEHGGHPDGALATTDADRVIGDIVALIRRERPDVVVTFGPEGAATQHRDHRAISRLATAAFFLAGTATSFAEQLTPTVQPHRAARLCYVTWPMPPADSIYQVEGQPIHAEIDARPWNARKMEAFLTHVTQRDHREVFERYSMTPSEYFSVASGVPLAAGATDLFSGIGS